MTLAADSYDPTDSPVMRVDLPGGGGMVIISGTAVKNGDGWENVNDDLEIMLNPGVDTARIVGVIGTAFPTSYKIYDQGLIAIDRVTAEVVAGSGVRLEAHLVPQGAKLLRVGFQVIVTFRGSGPLGSG